MGYELSSALSYNIRFKFTKGNLMLFFRHKYKQLPVILTILFSLAVAQAEEGPRHRSGTKPKEKNPLKETLLDQAHLPNTGSNTPVSNKKKSNTPGKLGTGLPCEAQHSVETYVQMTSTYEPQADSMGGVYFLSDLRESPQVFYLAQANQWPNQITFFAEGVVNYQLSPRESHILFSTQNGGNEQYQISLLNLKTRQMEHLIGSATERVESYFWGPREDWVVFTSNRRNGVDFDLYRIDLASRKETLLSELQGLNQITDVSPDGQLIAIHQYRSITDSDVMVFDQAKGKVTNLTMGLGKSSNRNGQFSANSKSIYVLSDFKSDKAQLILLPVADPAQAQVLSREKGEVEAIRLDKTRKHLIYVTNLDGYGVFTGTEVLSTGLFHKPFLVPQEKNAVLSSPSFSKPNQELEFFFARTSSVDPSGIWQWKSGRKVPWTQPNKGLIDSKCFSDSQLIKYPSFDGLEIPAYLFLPKTFATDKRPIPFVIYSHGGPEAQYRPTFSKIFQYFLQRGFGILAPNIRGSSGYGKVYVGLDNYKKRMDSIKDVLEGAKWLIKNGYTLPDKLGIFGGSYGGFVVLRSIQEGSDLFAAASESVGITDFVTFLKNTKPYRRALREVEYGPLSDEDFLKSVSPMTYLNKIKTPLLIFHGANDPRVPVNETEQLVQTLQDKKIPVEFKIFADEGHGNTKLRNILEQARMMVYFFEKHFGEQNKKGSS
jgi:dipeptidyl aminopeptidase/acylaminoacyl peptidase